MDPIIVEQVIQWFIDGTLAVKEGNAIANQYVPIFKQALAENRPLTDDERAQVTAFAKAEHDQAQA